MSPDTITQLRNERLLLLRLIDAVDFLLAFRGPDPGELNPDRPDVVWPEPTPAPAPAAPIPPITPTPAPKPRGRPAKPKAIRAVRCSATGTAAAAARETLAAMTGVFTSDDFHAALTTRVPDIRRKRTCDIICNFASKGLVSKHGYGKFERVDGPPTSPDPTRKPALVTRVLEACQALGRPVPRPDIIYWLQGRYPDEAGEWDNTKVDKALWQLRESKALVVTGEVQGISGPLKLHAVA